MRRLAGIALLAIGLGACQTTTVGQAPASTLQPISLFGPVVGADVISGRADHEGAVWLMVGGRQMVKVTLDARQFQRTLLAIPAGDECWGLARLNDGSLWTLRGRRTAIQIGDDGRVGREIGLTSPHLGLFGFGEDLIYQVADFTPSSLALKAGRPGDDHARPWSDITTRSFDGLARGAAVALNMVSCGAGRGELRACWFPDEAAIALVDASGLTRRMVLPGLAGVPPAVLLAAENPARPVRDAYVDETGAVWVLSSGTPPPGAATKSGAWILARYTPAGDLIDRRDLSEPVRLILWAGAGRAVLLTVAGMVAEVIP